MFSFFEKYKKFIFTGAIILLTVLALVTSGKKLNATIFESALGFVVTPFQDLTSGIGRGRNSGRKRKPAGTGGIPASRQHPSFSL